MNIQKQVESLDSQDTSMDRVRFEIISQVVIAAVTLALFPSVSHGEKYKESRSLDFTPVVDKTSRSHEYERVWGVKDGNIVITQENGLRVFFPKGTYSPQKSPIVGGGGFVYKLGTGYESAKLSYEVLFENEFDFVDGGKLPGLCSGTCPTGGAPVGQDFSGRFMWRKNGEGEFYAYTSDKKEEYGKSLGRGTFHFERGRYHLLEQEITMNTPGKNNGILIVYLDGKIVYRNVDMYFRDTIQTKIDRVIFSTFFGGSNSMYGARKDEHISFKNFKIFHNSEQETTN